MSQPKLLAVLDASVLVRAFLSGTVGSPARQVFEAALLGVFDTVLSEAIREEVYSTLGLARLGSYTRDDVDAVMGPLWARAIWVPEASDDDGVIAAAARHPKDVHVLRTAGSVYENAVPWRAAMFIVSEDSHHFPAGGGWGEFRYVDCLRFLQRLDR